MAEHGSTDGGPSPDTALARTVDGARSLVRDGVHTALGASLLTVNRLQVRRRDLRRWLDDADAAELAHRLRTELGALDQRIRRIEDRGDHLLARVGEALPAAAGGVVHHAREIAKDQSAQCRALLGLEV